MWFLRDRKDLQKSLAVVLARMIFFKGRTET